MSEDTAIDHSSQFSLDSAHKEGLRVVLPKATELLVDIDSDEDYAQFLQAWNRMKNLNLFGAQGFSVRPSKSGAPRCHITVKLGCPVTPLERIALQAILGSDWLRELFSMARLKDGDAVPTLFFEKP